MNTIYQLANFQNIDITILLLIQGILFLYIVINIKYLILMILLYLIVILWIIHYYPDIIIQIQNRQNIMNYLIKT